MKRISFSIACLLLFSLLTAVSCSNKPIKIGYTGNLSGFGSELGISGRNGAMMAVEQINEQGGIRGARVELLIEDEKHDPSGILAIDEYLIGQGVEAIVGHTTSTMTLNALPYLDRVDIPLISPGASSEKLEGSSKQLFRMNGSLRHGSKRAAEYAFLNRGAESFGALIDMQNKAFAESYYEIFRDTFKELGGKETHTIRFHSEYPQQWGAHAEALMDSGAESLLILASSSKTQNFALALSDALKSKQEEKPILLASGWSFSESLLRFASDAVEGMIFIDSFGEELGEEEKNSQFFTDYTRRFGVSPSSYSAMCYDAVKFLTQGIQLQKEKKIPLTDALAGIERFSGAFGEIIMKPNQEALRPITISTVQDGQYKLIETSMEQ